MVFYATVIEYVTTDLRTPLDLLLSGLHLGLLGHAMLQLLIVKDGTQLTHSVLTVLGLVASLGILDQDLFFLTCIRVLELITQANSGFHLVHVLSSGAARAERIPRDSRRLYLYLDRIIHQRGDEYGGERSHSFTLGVVRRYTYQTMHAILAL